MVFVFFGCFIDMSELYSNDKEIGEKGGVFIGRWGIKFKKCN